jgi:hypothetical protein
MKKVVQLKSARLQALNKAQWLECAPRFRRAAVE